MKSFIFGVLHVVVSRCSCYVRSLRLLAQSSRQCDRTTLPQEKVGRLAKPKQGTTVLHLRIFPLPAAVQAFAATSSTRLSNKSFDSIKHHNTEVPPNLRSMSASTPRLHKTLLHPASRRHASSTANRVHMLRHHCHLDLTTSQTNQQSLSSHNSNPRRHFRQVPRLQMQPPATQNAPNSSDQLTSYSSPIFQYPNSTPDIHPFNQHPQSYSP